MYSHGGLAEEMNSLFRLEQDTAQYPSSALLLMGTGAAAVVDHDSDSEKMTTSFENETESLYLTQLDSLNSLEAAAASASTAVVSSSAWNTDLCGSLIPQQPQRAMLMVRPEDVTGQKPNLKPEPMDEDTDADADRTMAMIEANFDLSTLMDHDHGPLPMAESTVIEETQETIDDMAQFLQTYEQHQPTTIKQEMGEEEESPAAAAAAVAAATEAESEAVSGQTELPSCLADELLSLEQRQTLDQMEPPSQLSEEDLKDAEQLLDTLLGGSSNNSSLEEGTVGPAAAQQSVTADILQTAVDSEGLADSGFQTLLEEAEQPHRYSVANVSHCVTPDGKQVIIVVQRPTTTAQRRKLMPKPVRHASSTDDDNDEDDPVWQPQQEQQQPQRRRPGRKREERVSLAATASSAAAALVGGPAPGQGQVTKRSYKNIKDRKERKKIQNVEAARRYRDKKKQEQVDMETEEAIQKAKNRKLKGQLKDITSEVNTMKKLMKELGMLK